MVANTGCVKIGQKVIKALIISVIVVRPASGIVMRFTVGVLTVGIVAVIAIVSLIVSEMAATTRNQSLKLFFFKYFLVR